MSRLTARFCLLLAVPVAAGLAAFACGGRGRLAVAAAPAVRQDPAAPAQDPRLKGAYRFEENGWIYVHLVGSPENIGFQHGYLLAPEIADAFRAVRLEDVHNAHHPWSFFRKAAGDMLWPKLDPEYQAELGGIVAGATARGVTLALDDVVALNAFQELAGYYAPWYDARQRGPAAEADPPVPEHCSAFVATGTYTKTHDIVMAHNNWTTYVEGERWRIIFDIVPEHGYRILMDGFPGVITSDDDFGINADGIMVTETTIAGFHGWNPNGVPEFERSRKALQYAGSIADYVKLVNEGNNGGYANDWLLGDRKNGEIARFEQGLRHTRLWTTKDGFFVGSNFPSDPQVREDETTFNPRDKSDSCNARHRRWNELMAQYKGKIDPALAEKFESDHYDAFEAKLGPDGRTLCGHLDLSPAGPRPYEPFGAVQGKVTDSEMVARMSLIARLGHPCGESFYAKPYFAAHPQYDWEKPVLGDMPAYPWTTFTAGERAEKP